MAETPPRFNIQRLSEIPREDGQPLDPEIRFYTRCGLKPAKVVRNYMEDDPESENYGVVMIWENLP